MSERTLAWHWTNGALRNGAPIPENGVTLVHSGPVEMCRSGLHASRRVLDALRYAPGPIVHRVEVAGIEEEWTDKLVCRERTILWHVDAKDLLRDFARRCALDVVDLWDPPDVVREYLKTGDQDLRDAARAAARDAAWAAARAAASAASLAAARDAARDAARAAARAAVWGAWAASRAASWAAARDADWAAWDDARDRQNRRLTAMISAHQPEGNR